METIEFLNDKGDTLIGNYSPGERDYGVIFAPGFGRNVYERKFHDLAHHLSALGIPSFGINYTGRVPSEGSFYNTTITSLGRDIVKGVEKFQEVSGIKEVGAVGHSAGVAAIAQCLIDPVIDFKRIVGLASALNWKKLTQFHMTGEIVKLNDPYSLVRWGNYEIYLRNIPEAIMQAHLALEGRIVNSERLGSSFYQEAIHLNFERILSTFAKRFLLIHGTNDISTPLGSINVDLFPQKLIVPGANHNMEHPDILPLWMPDAVKFLTEYM
jgi:pimeloyl-ACP methyl ester carboxylesterase